MEKEISFEESLKKLESIVTTLENGVDELEDIVNLFELGSEAAQLCSKKLEDVENKIEILSKTNE